MLNLESGAHILVVLGAARRILQLVLLTGLLSTTAKQNM
jgi:hypothetical protein